VRVESVTLPDERIVFVLRGARGAGSGVFLHGLCGHGLGYLQSFQHAAAAHGRWVAPHGDAPCGAGPWRSWSGRIRQIHEHSMAGLAEAGVRGEPKDVTLVGYSLGASRALVLAREFPAVYTRLILIAAPSMPAPAGLKQVRGAVMMAGSRDRQDAMQAGARAFERAGIPATYRVLPGAAHGEMGSSPEAALADALDWLDENARD
jgi:predicted esterase